jgi:hypothetical protein
MQPINEILQLIQVLGSDSVLTIKQKTFAFAL